jgi:hypothetical protein
MPQVRGMRLLQAVETGNTSSACLDSLLSSDPGRYSDFSTLMVLPGTTQVLAQSNTAMNTIAKSNSATCALFSYPTSSGAVWNSTTATCSIFNSCCAVNILANSPTGLNTLANNNTALTCMVNNNSALCIISSSPSARSTLANNHSFMSCALTTTYGNCWGSYMPWKSYTTNLNSTLPIFGLGCTATCQCSGAARGFAVCLYNGTTYTIVTTPTCFLCTVNLFGALSCNFGTSWCGLNSPCIFNATGITGSSELCISSGWAVTTVFGTNAGNGNNNSALIKLNLNSSSSCFYCTVVAGFYNCKGAEGSLCVCCDYLNYPLVCSNVVCWVYYNLTNDYCCLLPGLSYNYFTGYNSCWGYRCANAVCPFVWPVWVPNCSGTVNVINFIGSNYPDQCIMVAAFCGATQVCAQMVTFCLSAAGYFYGTVAGSTPCNAFWFNSSTGFTVPMSCAYTLTNQGSGSVFSCCAWTCATNTPCCFISGPIRSIAHSCVTNITVVLPSYGTQAAWSNNHANTWYSSTLPYPTQWSCVCVNGSLFVAIPDGAQGIVASNGIVSTDGNTWNTFNLPSSDRWVMATSPSANNSQFYIINTKGSLFAPNF